MIEKIQFRSISCERTIVTGTAHARFGLNLIEIDRLRSLIPRIRSIVFSESKNQEKHFKTIHNEDA